jgi:UDP-N-acetylglucosamine 2-epimerase (non-hydrolysing)
MKVTLVAGARPNFMKIAPIISAIDKWKADGASIDYRLVHTGQHYNKDLSDTFFEQLGIPEPHANLEVGSGSHAAQTANIMIKFEQELLKNPTDIVLVVGDVNSTMAATLVAKKMNTAVAHVEAGLRSYDMDMPEEINRMVTDSIADYFFTTTPEAGDNLVRTGIPKDKIYFVGNTMIDTLIRNLERLQAPEFWKEFNLREKEYFLLTLHRPSNVDDTANLKLTLDAIYNASNNLKIVFPVHPRTRQRLESIANLPKNIYPVSPVGYLQFIYLTRNARGVITDSGGVQEETTYLHVPCLTLRENTERPETISIGTNELIGNDRKKLKEAMEKICSGYWKTGSVPELWDGYTGERIAGILLTLGRK